MAKISDDFPGAALLIAAGYTTEAKVKNASDGSLLAVEGIGPATLEKIREAQSGEAEASTQEAEEAAGKESPIRKCSNPTCGYEISVSPCPYCGAA